jgi:hypothetical protein
VTVSVLFGDGTGAFASPLVVFTGPNPSPPGAGYSPSGSYYVGQISDLNGDGYPDLLLVWDGYNLGKPELIFLNDGSGHFAASRELTSGGACSTGGGWVGDFNGDGRPDIASSSQNTAIPLSTALNTNVTCIWLGDGAGGFASPLQFGGLPLWATPVKQQGFLHSPYINYNSDGKLDYVLNTTDALNSPGSSVLLGTGLPGFGDPISLLSGPSTFFYYAAPDLDHDGRPDLIGLPSASGMQQIAVLLNNFSTTTIPSTPTVVGNGTPNAVLLGQPLAFSADVLSFAGFANLGSVNFVTDTTNLGTVNVNHAGTVTLSAQPYAPLGVYQATTAALSYTFPAVGVYQVRANYSGGTDSNNHIEYNASTSDVFPVTVNNTPLATTIGVASTGGYSGCNAVCVDQGQAVTFTASVASGTITPNVGIVQFFDGSSSMGTVAVDNNGKATLAPLVLAPGPHSATASYAPTANSAYQASTSPALSVIVLAADFTLTTQPGPAVPYATNQPEIVNYYVLVGPVGGFRSPVTFACSGILREQAARSIPQR